jgi:predicted Zn-dependent protease
MRKAGLVALVVLLLLAAAMPSAAQPPADKDEVKLKVFIHYPKPAKPAPPGVCDPTVNDQVSTYALAGWKHSGTVTYHVNYRSVPSQARTPQTAIQNSYATWMAKANGKATFVEGTQTTVTKAQRDGLNIVAWGSTPSSAIAATYTWYYQSGVVIEQDIIMNSRLRWSYTQASNPDAVCGDLYSYDVQDILTHEVGHIFGLSDLYNSGDHDLTMYGYGDEGELKKDTLGAGDIAGMAALYPPNP